uniref:Uncharacterized protein n=1 Tax=Arundo donax TaxID=35708 RepID=A0A0A9BCC5_ARUDO
MYMESSVI